MTLQKQVLLNFKKTFNNPTLNQSKDILGLNLTRVFRLNNGYEMKLSEYEVFMKALNKNERSKIDGELNELFEKFKLSLSLNSKVELRDFLQRKIDYKNLVETPEFTQSTTQIA